MRSIWQPCRYSLYTWREREILMDIFEMVSGQRMMTSYFRPGGLWRDLPNGFEEAVQQFIDLFPARIEEYENLLTENPLYIDRTKGIGVISQLGGVGDRSHWAKLESDRNAL